MIEITLTDVFGLLVFIACVMVLVVFSIAAGVDVLRAINKTLREGAGLPKK